MAIIKTILSNKGKSLGAMAAVAKTKNTRDFFATTVMAVRAGRIKNLVDIGGDSAIQRVVIKFTRTEKNLYTKHLVPLGFPSLEVIQKMTIKAGVAGAAQVTEHYLMDTLEEHIDYLKEESFFQKAHREAKKQNIFGRSPEAREWYHDYALQYSTGFNYTNMMKEGGTRASKPMRGKMMFFSYRPDKVTSAYDLYPLIFVLDRQTDYFTGINFHYIVPKLRALTLGNMLSYLNNLDFDLSTELNFKQFLNAVDKNKKFKFAKASLRRYKPSNIQGKMIEVHPLDWELSIMVATSKFFSEMGSRVASQEIWKKTRLNA